MIRRIAIIALLLAASTPVAAWAESAQENAAPAAEEPQDCVGKARLRGLVFGNDGSEIEAPDQVMLDLVAEAIKTRCAGKTITIEGHTSVSGSPEHNQKLSERRAEAVERYLVAHGVPEDQLRTVGYGESRPLSTDPSPEAQRMNRRVTLVAQ
jgi:outer membrane protein OmpA-like peptidoglycan-associated protein